MNTSRQNKIALFSMSIGKDRIFFDSVRRCFLSNKENFGRNKGLDYFLLTVPEETIEGIKNIPCPASVCSFVAILKNNQISESIYTIYQIDGTNTFLFSFIDTGYEY